MDTQVKIKLWLLKTQLKIYKKTYRFFVYVGLQSTEAADDKITRIIRLEKKIAELKKGP
jgi:hypothetical protein